MSLSLGFSVHNLEAIGKAMGGHGKLVVGVDEGLGQGRFEVAQHVEDFKKRVLGHDTYQQEFWNRYAPLASVSSAFSGSAYLLKRFPIKTHYFVTASYGSVTSTGKPLREGPAASEQ